MDFLSGRRTTAEERPRVSFSENHIGNGLISRIFTKNRQDDKQIQELNQVIDVDKDLRIFQQNQLNLLNPKILYDTGYFAKTNQLYRHYREEQISAMGFIGKIASKSNTRFRLKVEDVVEVMGNKGIKLIKPIKINPEEYAGLEWNLENLNKKKVLTPDSHLMYTNTKGETSIRFTDYNYSNQTNLEEELELEELEEKKEFMNVEIIQEGYEVDEALQEAERRYNNNNDITFKCKGCKTRSMGIVEVEKHFKTCTFRTDNLGYREEYENQEKFANLEKILENLYDSDDEIERNSIISQKELRESTSSSASPFQRIAQPHTIDTSMGNVPRRRVFRVNPDTVTENVRPMGRRMPIEEPIRLQEGESKGKTLNIAAHDPQMWNAVIDLWKGIVVAVYKNIPRCRP
ncbi:hypothetical protein H5410_037119 [Solanum commersonii]|uniref:Uncharacterized protein n=1 Tax=Solanum commersonii TaxID=4109 RepID=A0A9J5Y7K5_SOLCO|nr:hypothetical protein H5410_037119 [Solanum commersonii]